MKRYADVVFLLSLLTVLLCSPTLAVENDALTTAKKHLSFGIQQKNAGDNIEARRQLEKSISFYDSLNQVHYVYDDLLLEMGENDTAIEAFERALELNPEHYNAAARLASLYSETKNYEGTLIIYALMYKLKPENTKLLASMSNIREFLGNNEGAYADLRKLIETGGRFIKVKIPGQMPICR